MYTGLEDILLLVLLIKTNICQDLLSCMKSVGMNPSEQELLDMINEVVNKTNDEPH